MLGPLAFKTMRQQHHQTTVAPPLVFAGNNELVDYHLRAVGEITELRFPQYQGFGFGGGEAVFESQHSELGQQRIEHAKIRPRRANAAKRHKLFAVFLVMQHRMAMKKRAASAVLTGQPHRVAFVHQRGVSHGFRKTPVHRQRVVRHLVPVLHDFGDTRMQFKTFRNLLDNRVQLLDFIRADASVGLVQYRATGDAAPVYFG